MSKIVGPIEIKSLKENSRKRKAQYRVSKFKLSNLFGFSSRNNVPINYFQLNTIKPPWYKINLSGSVHPYLIFSAVLVKFHELP